MSNKIVVLVSTILGARPKPAVTCRPAKIPTLGTQITTKQPERAPDDYSHMFLGF